MSSQRLLSIQANEDQGYCEARDEWDFLLLPVSFSGSSAVELQYLRGNIDPAHPDPGGKKCSVPWNALLCTKFHELSLLRHTGMGWACDSIGLLWKEGTFVRSHVFSCCWHSNGRDLHRPTLVSLRSEQMQSSCHGGLIPERKVNSSVSSQKEIWSMHPLPAWRDHQKAVLVSYLF